MNAAAVDTTTDVRVDVESLYRDGIVGRQGAFTRQWAEDMREDITTAFWEAIQRPGGAVGRGPRRWYVEIHPQGLRGFVDLVTHHWVSAMCEAVLGPEYQIVEVGFDTPFQGAKNQPWHRDFPSPEESWKRRRITSLAFNLTGVDVTPDMGPFEVAPGTQWDDGRDWTHEMFPAQALWPRFTERAVRKYPKMGDISCRSALTVHPPVWKREVGIKPGKEGAKDAARAEAIRRWPAMAEEFAAKGSDGRAEAALIAVAGMARAKAG